MLSFVIVTGALVGIAGLLFFWFAAKPIGLVLLAVGWVIAAGAWVVRYVEGLRRRERAPKP